MDIEGRYAGFTLELREPGIAWITLERADGATNGFTAATKSDLVDVVHELGFRPDIRVLVLAAGSGGFCAGDDFRAYYDEAHWDREARGRNLLRARRSDQLGVYDRLRLAAQKLTQAVYETDLITVAAIDGVCIQSGLSLALACDFRIATSAARLGSATLRFGFQPDENGHFLLVRQIGVSRTLDFLINKRILGGEDALQWGLVNELVEPEALEAQAMALARRIAEGPMVATRMLKRAVYRAYELDFAAAAEDIALRAAITDHSPDTAEGVKAWREKRRPKFNANEEPSDRHE